MRDIRIPMSCFVLVVAMLSGCATSVGASASFRVPQNDAKNAQALAQVRFDKKSAVCANPQAQVTPPMQIFGLLRDWRDWSRGWNAASRHRYSTPEIDYQNPSLEYPKALWEDRVYGAVLMLILINPDGSVSATHAVCATRPEFIPYANKTLATNRYRPAMVDGKPVRDVAYQIVAFNPRPEPQ